LLDPEIDDVVSRFEAVGLELHVVELLTDFPVLVYAAMVIDRTGAGPAFTIGASASASAKSAFMKATSEALTTRLAMKNKNYDDFDEHDIDRDERIMYWCDPKRLLDIEFLFRGEKKIRELKHLGYANLKKDYKNILTEMRARKYPVYSVEISDTKSKKLGLRTVQIVIPQLQPLHLNEQFPYFGGERLHDVPNGLGYTPAKTLNALPHPFP